MFNVIVSLPVIVYALQLLRICVCDVLDDADQQTMLDDILPELYKKYRYAMGGSAEDTFTYRRAFNNKEYMIHINRLKAVNGHKKHNLIIKEKSNDNPIIYISNPVETKVPNAYLSLEGFKELLIGRALRQRNEFQQMYKTTSASKSSLNNRIQFTKRKPKQNNHNKYDTPITTKTNKMPTNTIKNTKTARAKDMTKTKVPLALILSTNIEHTSSTKLNVSEPATEPNTLLVEAIAKTSRTTKSTLVVQSGGENKTEKTISKKLTMEESKTKTPTSHGSTGEELTHITTTDQSSTEEVISKNSFTKEPIENVSMEKFTIVKHGTTITTDNNSIIHDTLGETTEKRIVDSITETKLNVLRTINMTDDSESKEIRKKEIIEKTPLNTETSSLGETTVSEVNGPMTIENSNNAESKESIIADLSAKVATMQESTTDNFKESSTEPTKKPTTNPTKESATESTKESTTDSIKETTTEPIKESTENTTEPAKEKTIEPKKESTLAPTKESTTEPKKVSAEATKESTTEQLRPKRKTTTEEPSVESYLPKWTKRTTRPTTTTKATTKRRTLGRPLVYMGGMEEGNQWG